MNPSYCIKVVAKEVFKLAISSREKEDCELIDALRFKKYIGCYIYKNRHLPLDGFQAKDMEPIEDLFDCHKRYNPE